MWSTGPLTEIPFADAGRRITFMGEHVGKRDDFLVHLLGVLNGDQAIPFRSSPSRIANRVHAMARRVLARHQAGAARRTVWGVGVGLLEQQPIGGHVIQIGGIDDRGSRAAQIVPTHIIDVDKHDVRISSVIVMAHGRSH